jgi:flagellar basal-body rod protein FlgC
MNEFDVLSAASAGMDAQRAALDLAARNVAAAEAASPNGSFERLVPRFALAPSEPESAGSDDGFDAPDDKDPFDDSGAGGAAVRYLGAVPEHGVDADAITEMVAVLDAQRAYEANASVFDIGKRLAERTIDVGRLQ